MEGALEQAGTWSVRRPVRISLQEPRQLQLRFEGSGCSCLASDVTATPGLQGVSGKSCGFLTNETHWI